MKVEENMVYASHGKIPKMQGITFPQSTSATGNAGTSHNFEGSNGLATLGRELDWKKNHRWLQEYPWWEGDDSSSVFKL
jgi:hypothetical protein